MRRQKTLFGILFLVILIGALALIRSQPWGRVDLRFLKPDSSGWIACIKVNENEHGDLSVIKPDGSEILITNDEANDLAPDWSPDGKKIVFSSNRVDNVYQLFTVDPDGAGISQLTQGSGAKLEPTYDTDGKHILYIAQGIVTEIDAKGIHAEQLVPPPHLLKQMQEQMGQLSFRYARRAPTERRLIGAAQRVDTGELAIFHYIHPDYQQETPPVTLLEAVRVDIDWSKNSSKMVLAAAGAVLPDPQTNQPRKVSMLAIIDFTENVLQPALSPPLWGSQDNTEAAIQPVWSPDGTRIAYVRCEFEKNGALRRTGLMVIASDGGSPTELMDGEAWDPSWSPDGKQIVFSLGPEGNRQLYTVTLEGEQKPLTQSGDYIRPRFSPK